MQIPRNEQALPLVDAIEAATGYRPHLSTCLRWCQRPNRYGIRLESWRIGGRRVTSIAAVQRYNEATTAAANNALGIPLCPRPQRSKAHATAIADLNREFQ
ncbi:MAG: DUF1580 domain-containing protein [Pirellulaceae bacterium]